MLHGTHKHQYVHVSVFNPNLQIRNKYLRGQHISLMYKILQDKEIMLLILCLSKCFISNYYIEIHCRTYSLPVQTVHEGFNAVSQQPCGSLVRLSVCSTAKGLQSNIYEACVSV